MTVEPLLTGLGRTMLGIVSPLESALRTGDTANNFLVDFGWLLTLTDAEVSQIRDGLVLLTHLQAAVQSLSRLESEADGIDPAGAIQLLETARSLISGIADGVSAATTHILPEAAVTQISVELPDYLISKYLRQFQPGFSAILTGFGVLQTDLITPTGIDRVPYTRRRLHWDRLPVLVTDPASTVAEVFGWGSTLNAGALLAQLGEAAELFGFHTSTAAAEAAIVAALDPIGVAPPIQQLEIALVADVDDAGVAHSIVLLLAASTNSLAIRVRLDGDPTSIPAIFGPIGVSLGGGFALSPALLVILRPGEHGLVGSESSGTLTLCRSSAPPVVFGPLTSTHVITRKASLTVEVAEAVSSAGPVVEVGLVLSIDDATLTVDLDVSDGFLGHMLGDLAREVDLSLALDWSSRGGLRVRGAAGLRVNIPVSESWGPLHLDFIRIGISVSALVSIVAAVSGRAALGPFAVTLDGIGARIELEPAAEKNSGILGGLDLACRFEPPTGVGLSLQTPAVSGGGFLLFDVETAQYAGVFELTLAGSVSVKAVALVSTRLPDGKPGFALLIMITAEGFTPFPLGMGFSLTGIGGLLALNRTINADAIRGGLRNGVLDSILFVKDPVKNATRILSTLEQVFPIAADRLVIGPLVEISWGSPPILKIRAALLLEIPDPVHVVLLAALSVQLPAAANAVVEIHVDAFGDLDLAKRELSLDASLHDSRLLKFTLTGDMALRLTWGAQPDFVLSIGGFHPRFTPPKGLRPLNRLALTLSNSDNPRLRLEAYLALTSNTIQMGARVEVHAEEAGFALDGGGSFDALIQWSPFALDVAFAAWVKVSAGGGTLLAISLSLNVTGPQPWHIVGQASIQVLAITAKVGLDLTIGPASSPSTPVETVDVSAEMWAQLSDPAHWQAVMPASSRAGVTLAGVPAASASDPVVAHPLAALSVRQQVAPLATPIERIGARLPAGGTLSYTLAASALSGVVSQAVTELFAPAQYANLSDDERLAGPSFVAMSAGISLVPENAFSRGPALSCDLSLVTLDVTSLDSAPVAAPAFVATAATAQGPLPRPTHTNGLKT